MKEFFEILKSIPFFNIIVTIFSGDLGWRTPLAFVVQVALQIFCAVMLGLGGFGTFTVAALLLAINLGMGLVVAMMPLSGMGPGKPIYTTIGGYVRATLLYSLLFSGFCSGIVLGVACLAASAGILAFAKVLALSTIGAAVIHLFGVVLPVYRATQQQQQSR